MEQIRKVEDLPSWFNLKDYDYINTLSRQQIYIEAESRAFYLDCLRGIIDYSDLDKEKLKEKLNKGHSMWKDSFNEFHKDGPEEIENEPNYELFELITQTSNERHGSTYGGVGVASVSSIQNARESISYFLSDYDDSTQKQYLNSIADFDSVIALQKITNTFNPSSILLEVDLKGDDDKILIEGFKKLLADLRSSLKIEEPKMPSPKNLDIDKINAYKLIAISDLKMWELLHNKKITNRVLAAALWPCHSRDSDHLKQIILPLFNKVFCCEYFKSRLNFE